MTSSSTFTSSKKQVQSSSRKSWLLLCDRCCFVNQIPAPEHAQRSERALPRLQQLLLQAADAQRQRQRGKQQRRVSAQSSGGKRPRDDVSLQKRCFLSYGKRKMGHFLETKNNSTFPKQTLTELSHRTSRENYCHLKTHNLQSLKVSILLLFMVAYKQTSLVSQLTFFFLS